MVKNLPAMWETWVQSLSWEDPLEEGVTTHFSILAWGIPMDRGAWQAIVMRWQKSDTTEVIYHIGRKAENKAQGLPLPTLSTMSPGTCRDLESVSELYWMISPL